MLSTSIGNRDLAADDADLFVAHLAKPVRSSQLFDALVGVVAGSSRIETATHVDQQLVLDPAMSSRYPLRILLAEDNVVNQKLATRLLERMGYRIDVASNGFEAVESVARQRYDVVLMDIQMPELDGLEATRRIIGSNPTGDRPTIIAMTANAMDGDREMCLAAGMDDYVSKPIRVAELAEALRRAWSSRHEAIDARPSSRSSTSTPTASSRRRRALSSRPNSSPRSSKKRQRCSPISARHTPRPIPTRSGGSPTRSSRTAPRSARSPLADLARELEIGALPSGTAPLDRLEAACAQATSALRTLADG